MNRLFLYIFFVFLISEKTLAATDGSSVLTSPRKSINSAEEKPHVGIRMGTVNPEGSYDGSFEYGVEVGYQPYIPFGVGLELGSFSSNNSEESDLERTKLLLKGSYNLGGNTPIIRDSFFSAGVGPVLDTQSGTARGRVGMSLATGFDLPIAGTNQMKPESYSIGAGASYLFVSDNAPETFSLSGIVKYWF